MFGGLYKVRGSVKNAILLIVAAGDTAAVIPNKGRQAGRQAGRQRATDFVFTLLSHSLKMALKVPPPLPLLSFLSLSLSRTN